MTVLRFIGICALLFSAALIPVIPAWASTRINGNQMVEGLGNYSFAFQSAARGAAAATDQRNYQIFTSLGQGVIAQGTLPDSVAAGGGNVSLAIGVGLAYDILVYNPIPCPVSMTGDVNQDGDITIADIINLVHFVYLSDSGPKPCIAVGDVNCTGNITSADLVYLVRYVFQGGEPPCDVCNLIPDVWPCGQ